MHFCYITFNYIQIYINLFSIVEALYSGARTADPFTLCLAPFLELGVFNPPSSVPSRPYMSVFKLFGSFCAYKQPEPELEFGVCPYNILFYSLLMDHQCPAQLKQRDIFLYVQVTYVVFFRTIRWI